MSKARTWKRAAGVSAIALLFGASVASAQSTQNPSTGTQSGQSTQATPGTQGATSQSTTTTATTAATGTVKRADQKLMVEMAQANLAEIEAARIAQSKTQNDQVRNFAQQMIDDHTRALQDLQQLAQAKGVTLPTEADRKHKKMGQKMSAMSSGPSFDRSYLAQSGVSDHKKTHSLLRRVQSRAADPDLKALAARLQPVVDQHLSSVQQLQGAMRGGASGTASGTSTSGTSGGGNAGNTNTQQPQQQQQPQQPQQQQQQPQQRQQ